MLKNMKIGRRLVTAFIVVALIVSISGIVGAFLFQKMDKDYSFAMTNYAFSTGTLGNLGMKINENRAFIRDIVFLDDKVQMDDALAKMQKNASAIDQLILSVESTNIGEEAKAIFTTFKADLITYREVQNRVSTLGMALETEEAHAIWVEEGMPLATKMGNDIDTLMALKFSVGQGVSDDLTASGQTMLLIIFGVIAAGLAIAIIFALYISRGISKPTNEIEQAAVKMAKGDYDINIEYTANDEVGSLANSMRTMVTTTKAIILDIDRGLGLVANSDFDIAPETEFIGIFKRIETSILNITTELSKTMAQVKTSADQVSGGSDHVSSASQALAQGATEQASAVEELSASISEVSEQIKQNAKNSSTASDLVDSVGLSIGKSNEQMNHMTLAMAEISDSSTQIGKIIKTIEDIAFQTNILALNAAVEAARAGAAGKGFAVVADEVRNLATKSSEAAKQTNVLIEGSVKSVESGVKIAEETAASLSEVVSGAEKITALIAKISQASSEQASSISQINQGVEQISSVVQTNSATSEESAAASEELSGQAGVMKDLISKFNLKRGVSTQQIHLDDSTSFDFSSKNTSTEHFGGMGGKY